MDTRLFMKVDTPARMRRIQVWTAKHAITLITLSLFGIVGWLLLITTVILQSR